MQSFYSNGGTFPSFYQMTGVGPWCVSCTDIYAPLGSSEVTAAQQFQVTPYLLKRGLDPASNDNSPMWLDAAA
jgi:hypothetical protein